VAGLTQSTRRDRCHYARLFLSTVFAAGHTCWDQLKATDLQTFIEGYARSGHTGSALIAASSLRRFLRWLLFAGLLAKDLTGALSPLRTRPRDGLPQTLTPQQEQALLDCFDLTLPVGRRDHAMTLCLLRLGLRVPEVAVLTVADLDADAATLRIAPAKSDALACCLCRPV
jgi:site-specific recombinase XerC